MSFVLDLEQYVIQWTKMKGKYIVDRYHSHERQLDRSITSPSIGNLEIHACMPNLVFTNPNPSIYLYTWNRKVVVPMQQHPSFLLCNFFWVSSVAGMLACMHFCISALFYFVMSNHANCLNFYRLFIIEKSSFNYEGGGFKQIKSDVRSYKI